MSLENVTDSSIAICIHILLSESKGKSLMASNLARREPHRDWCHVRNGVWADVLLVRFINKVLGILYFKTYTLVVFHIKPYNFKTFKIKTLKFKTLKI